MLVSLPLVAALAGSAAAEPSPPATREDPRVVAALELARGWLEGQRAYDQIPGLSAAIVHDQQVLWIGGFGQADVEGGKPAGPETLYSICSISKLFTAIAVMQQRDAGKLRLDDPVSRHLPWFDLKRGGEGEVTVEGLLTHAAGLPRESDHAYWSAPDFPFPSHEEIVQGLKAQEALYAPETAFQYSNLGLTLAGECVAAVSGTPYPDYVKRAILEPLGLRDTTPDMPESERGRRLATGYAALDRSGRRKPLPFFKTNGIAPAAGYASTAADLARFASWQFRLLEQGGAEVLKATTLREMHRVHWVEPDLETLRGLGFAVWKNEAKLLVGHEGSCPGYRSSLLLMPEERVATIVLANAQGVEVGRLAQRLYDIVAPALRASVKERGKGKTPQPELRRYAGTYDLAPWSGELLVFPWEDGLGMLGLPSGNPMKDLVKLKKTGEHTFRRVRKDDALAEQIVFEMDASGRPLRLKRHSNYYPRLEAGAP